MSASKPKEYPCIQCITCFILFVVRPHRRSPKDVRRECNTIQLRNKNVETQDVLQRFTQRDFTRYKFQCFSHLKFKTLTQQYFYGKK